MNSDNVVIITGLLLSLALPFLAEPLNNLWKLDGPKALALAGLLAGVLSFIALYLTGAITNTQLQTLTVENYLHLFLGVYAASQTEFQLIKNQMGWTGVKTQNVEPVG